LDNSCNDVPQRSVDNSNQERFLVGLISVIHSLCIGMKKYLVGLIRGIFRPIGAGRFLDYLEIVIVFRGPIGDRISRWPFFVTNHGFKFVLIAT